MVYPEIAAGLDLYRLLVVLVVRTDVEKQRMFLVRKCQEPLEILFAVTLLAS